MKTKLPQKRGRGFTLIELIIYIAIVSVVLAALTFYLWDMIGVSMRAATVNELAYNGAVAVERLSYEVRMAESVGASSVFDAEAGVLAIISGGQEILFDTYERQIDAGGAPVTIRTLRMRAGGEPVDLTTGQVTVRQFLLRNLSRSTGPKNISLDIIFDSVNPSADPRRERSLELSTSVSLRAS